MDTVRHLESFGVRKGGSAAETEAMYWLEQQLRDLGYTTRMEQVPLPDGSVSHNVIARAVGASQRVVVLGAHVDSKPPSPGANDNGSGCGALLEIARIIAEQPATPTVEFVFFGAEEIFDDDPDHHHLGSRYRVRMMTAAERANTAGMISVDMIAYGSEFHSRTMLRGPQQMSDIVLAQAQASGVKMTFLKDPGATGWSDHEAYELAGIPAAWIEWSDDPVYHTADDTSDHCDAENIRVAGQLVLDVLRSLDAADLEALVTR
jgi:aminopeptidase YwaD